MRMNVSSKSLMARTGLAAATVAFAVGVVPVGQANASLSGCSAWQSGMTFYGKCAKQQNTGRFRMIADIYHSGGKLVRESTECVFFGNTVSLTGYGKLVSFSECPPGS